MAKVVIEIEEMVDHPHVQITARFFSPVRHLHSGRYIVTLADQLAAELMAFVTERGLDPKHKFYGHRIVTDIVYVPIPKEEANEDE